MIDVLECRSQHEMGDGVRMRGKCMAVAWMGAEDSDEGCMMHRWYRLRHGLATCRSSGSSSSSSSTEEERRRSCACVALRSLSICNGNPHRLRVELPQELTGGARRTPPNQHAVHRLSAALS